MRRLIGVLLVFSGLWNVNLSWADGLNQGLEPVSLATLLPQAQFDPNIPSPADVTGVEPGARPLRPAEALAYCQALADASPRAEFVTFGETYEGRPLYYLAISDEATIADLDAFKTRHIALLDPRLDGPQKAEALTTQKAVAWMAYGIHGDELSSTDAAVVLAYWLVAGMDEQAQQLRDTLLIIVDPCENPDGRARYLAQTMAFAHRTANPNLDDLSHRAVWPWGRGNHYLFDLNRDWFTQIQPESVRATEIARWLPQLMVDSHEMGANATYLFPPARHPFNPHLPPSVTKWERAFAVDQAQALDTRGYPYYSGEWNEEFFPGYGSTWAAYQGAVGILYEMSRTTGTVAHKRDGTVRTFAQAVEHQLTSSVANLVSLAGDKNQVLADQILARKNAMDAGAEGPVRAWVFPPDDRFGDRLAPFAQLLSDQGLEVQVLQSAKKVGRLTCARRGVTDEQVLPEGTLLVRLDQPAAAVARVLLDPHVPMRASFLQEERLYLEKGKGSRLYETTAWSLPLARGIAAFWSSRIPKGDWVPWEMSPAAPVTPVAGPWTSIIVDGDPANTPGFLAALFQKDITVRVAKKPFTVEGQVFQSGALVIRREGNSETVFEVVNETAQKHGVSLVPVNSFRTEEGPDLGGRYFPVLIAPRVGVLTGSPSWAGSYGAIWHLLDQRLDLRFSSLDLGRFRSIDLSRYNVLVFPPVSGGKGAYRQILGVEGLARLRSWIEAGGTAIGIGSGARLLADADPDTDTFLIKTRFRDQVLMTHPSPVWSIDAQSADAAGRPTATGLRVKAAAAGAETTKVQAVRTSPYDVAPVVGAGARPFTKGFEQGTPLSTPPVLMSQWLADVLPQGLKDPLEDDFKGADARLRRFMPQGVLLQVELDETYWLNFGLPARMAVWFGGNNSLIAAPGAAVAARFPEIEEIHLGGLLWPEAAARLALTGYSVREGLGRGQVVLFAGHPAYRRWMVESERQLINAVLLGPGLGTRWTSGW